MDKIAEVCTLAIDTVYVHIETTDLADHLVITARDTMFIDEHPLMQAELRRQEEELEEVARTQLDGDTLMRLKASAQAKSLLKPSS